MNFFDTFRHKRTTSDSNDSIQNGTADETQSQPEISNDESDGSQEIIKSLQKRVDELILDLNIAQQKISTLSSENTKLKQINAKLQRKSNVDEQKKKKTTNSSNPIKKKSITKQDSQRDSANQSSNLSTTTSKLNVTPELPASETKIQPVRPKKNKICIISTNKWNKITNIAETTLKEHSEDICHYIFPHCNTEQLFRGIKTKLKAFTMNDFCILLLGEDDFTETSDHFQMILQIRTALEDIKHTNVIICSPTYKYGYYTNVYNWRVENFNNLLYLDILTREHAYFLDSNKHLSCDYNMFNEYSGRINNRGMHTIFKDINDFIHGIKTYDLHTIDNTPSEQYKEEEDQFFL